MKNVLAFFQNRTRREIRDLSVLTQNVTHVLEQRAIEEGCICSQIKTSFSGNGMPTLNWSVHHQHHEVLLLLRMAITYTHTGTLGMDYEQRMDIFSYHGESLLSSENKFAGHADLRAFVKEAVENEIPQQLNLLFDQDALDATVTVMEVTKLVQAKR